MRGLADHIRTKWRADKDARFGAFGPGYKGPVIVAEGDSWFEYPFARDAIMALSEQYKIRCLAKAGATVTEVLAENELLPAVNDVMPDIVLVSIGGNDIIDRIEDFVRTFSVKLDRTGPAYVKATAYRAALRNLFERMKPTCTTILDLGLDIIVSGYDYPNPRTVDQGGQWIGPELLNLRKIDDRPLWHFITKHMIDLYEVEMRLFVARLNKNRPTGAQISFVSQINVVNDGTYAPDFGEINAQWNDEMHGTTDAFERVGNRLAQKIEQVMQRRLIPSA